MLTVIVARQSWGETEYMYQRYVLPLKWVIIRIQLLC